jgi:hypothetical protein
MKETYKKPEMEIVKFDVEDGTDVIGTSSIEDGDTD